MFVMIFHSSGHQSQSFGVRMFFIHGDNVGYFRVFSCKGHCPSSHNVTVSTIVTRPDTLTRRIRPPTPHSSCTCCRSTSNQIVRPYPRCREYIAFVCLCRCVFVTAFVCPSVCLSVCLPESIFRLFKKSLMPLR